MNQCQINTGHPRNNFWGRKNRWQGWINQEFGPKIHLIIEHASIWSIFRARNRPGHFFDIDSTNLDRGKWSLESSISKISPSKSGEQLAFKIPDRTQREWGSRDHTLTWKEANERGAGEKAALCKHWKAMLLCKHCKEQKEALANERRGTANAVVTMHWREARKTIHVTNALRVNKCNVECRHGIHWTTIYVLCWITAITVDSWKSFKIY